MKFLFAYRWCFPEPNPTWHVDGHNTFLVVTERSDDERCFHQCWNPTGVRRNKFRTRNWNVTNLTIRKIDNFQKSSRLSTVRVCIKEKRIESRIEQWWSQIENYSEPSLLPFVMTFAGIFQIGKAFTNWPIWGKTLNCDAGFKIFSAASDAQYGWLAFTNRSSDFEKLNKSPVWKMMKTVRFQKWQKMPKKYVKFRKPHRNCSVVFRRRIKNYTIRRQIVFMQRMCN